jgi:hypothetical protein
VNLSQAWASLVQQWRQNVRLRLGGWVILGIVLVYGLMGMTDVRKEYQAEYDQLAERLERLHALSQERQWPERMDQARALRVQMEGRLWRAESQGLAQATIQTWLDSRLKRIGMNEARVRVGDALPLKEIPGVWSVSTQVDGRFSPNQVLNLLKLVETSPQALVVERLEMVSGRRNIFNLGFKAYFLGAKQ